MVKPSEQEIPPAPQAFNYRICGGETGCGNKIHDVKLAPRRGAKAEVVQTDVGRCSDCPKG